MYNQKDTITYSEIFHSIQGEGSFMGIPSIFFRTSGCNLRCHWCDTPYTSFQPENKKIEILEAADLITAYDCKYVVITGGEPLIQPDKILSLCTLLTQRDRHITIETNGTKYVKGIGVFCDLMSISPKLSDSGPKIEQVKTDRWIKKHDKDRLDIGTLSKLINNTSCQFKFVVSNEVHIDEIEALQTILPNLSDNLIYLMPEGRTAKEIQDKQEFVVNTCIEKGWNYSDRLHVRIWGDKRGV